MRASGDEDCYRGTKRRHRRPVEAMELNEAMELLGGGISETDNVPLATLARRLREWPLLLLSVNSQLHEDVASSHMPLATASDSVNQELDEFGLTSFDVEDAE